MDWMLSQKDAAELIGRKPVFLRDHSCPNVKRGQYDARAVVLWHTSMIAAGDTEEVTDLKEEKLREEINVLKQRCQKLEIENDTKTGHMIDVRELKELQGQLATCIRKAGDLMARKTKLTGRDAQQILNKALDEFHNHLEACLLYTSPSPRDQRGSRMPSSA